jgi:hypothetical protein
MAVKALCLGVLFVLEASAAAQVKEIPPPISVPKRFELMKCSSPKAGTLWVSFGVAYDSDHPDPMYFPTEIVYFGNNGEAPWRWKFTSIPEARQRPLFLSEGYMAMKFETSVSQHALMVVRTGPNMPNSFSGSWNVSNGDKNSYTDSADCSID